MARAGRESDLYRRPQQNCKPLQLHVQQPADVPSKWGRKRGSLCADPLDLCIPSMQVERTASTDLY